MSDDYEPAIDMPADTADRADDVGDANDAPTTKIAERAEPVEPQSVRRGRVVSDKVRGMFAALAKEGAEDLVPVEHDSPPAAAGAAAAKSAKPAESPAAEPPPSSPPAAAAADSEADDEPAPDLAAAIADQAIKPVDEKRQKELDAREAAIREREAQLPSRTDVIERPAESIGAFLKSIYGVTDDKEYQDIVTDLVTDFSEKVLGVKLPEDVKTKMQSRRALLSVKAYKDDLAKQAKDLEAKRAETEAAAQKAREEAARAENERKAVAHVSKLLTAAKADYPYLHEQDSPASIVIDVVKEQLERGLKADWQAAARWADNYFKKEAETIVRKADRLKTLLAPAAPSAPAKATASPGAAPGPAAKPTPAATKTPAAPPATPDAASEEPAYEDRRDRRARQARELARRMQAQQAQR